MMHLPKNDALAYAECCYLIMQNDVTITCLFNVTVTRIGCGFEMFHTLCAHTI